MKCAVCLASFAGDGKCPSCGHDPAAPGANDPKAVLAAREEFRARTLQHDPRGRVTSRDKLKPWLGLLLGGLLFLLWLKACSSYRFF